VIQFLYIINIINTYSNTSILSYGYSWMSLPSTQDLEPAYHGMNPLI
jgi:hypothetical protein